ncbi:MAG: aminotransferase class I/II-fold pyridoxal phosphate-dependent enzyme, partial [Chloroflexi bacterium]
MREMIEYLEPVLSFVNDAEAGNASDPNAIQVAVQSLRKHIGIEFDPADVSMTTGAFGGLASTLRAVLDPGDEVIYLSPPWFFYVPMVISNGATAVRVDFEPPAFELPVEAI